MTPTNNNKTSLTERSTMKCWSKNCNCCKRV